MFLFHFLFRGFFQKTKIFLCFFIIFNICIFKAIKFRLILSGHEFSSSNICFNFQIETQMIFSMPLGIFSHWII
uniref:Uncharacterized protein n=1 Tax=Lepeophtheirus salmonis TaxID=72036 RepID=A0A0K2VH53_LEPSM